MLPKGFSIQDMEPAYAAGVGKVLYQGWEETYRGLMPDEVLNSRTLEQCVDIAAHRLGDALVVLTKQREVAGFVGYAPQARPFVERENTSEVIGLYLLRAYQKKGLGRALLEECFSRLPFPQVVLYVLDGNQNAIDFYRHMGFQFTGRQRKSPCPGGELTELEMLAKIAEK